MPSYSQSMSRNYFTLILLSLSYLQMFCESQILEGLFPHQCRRSLLATNIILVTIFFKLNPWLRVQSMVSLFKTRCLLHQVSSSSLRILPSIHLQYRWINYCTAVQLCLICFHRMFPNYVLNRF